MLLSRTDASVGVAESTVPFQQPVVRRGRLRLAGGSAEPSVPVDLLVKSLAAEEVETFRPLLPVGYQAGVEAYQHAVADLRVEDLTTHYTRGLEWFQETFLPHL